MPTCTRCGIEKEAIAFFKDRTKKAGHRPECRQCNPGVPSPAQKARRAAWRIQFDARIAERDRLRGEGLKRCNRCDTIKSLTEFYSAGKDEWQGYCKPCGKDHHDAWLAHNRPKSRASQLKGRMQSPWRPIWQQMKRRAAQQGIPCTLTLDDVRRLFQRTKICPVLGIPLVHNFKGKRGFKNDSPSIDRLQPERGYVPGNVAVISYRANRLKGDGTREELQQLLEWLDHRHAEVEAEDESY